MNTRDLLNIHPSELKFPFELKKQSSCSLQLINKTDDYIAFKVKTTNPKKYCVRPNAGIVLPGSTCDVTVTMQAQKEAPLDLQCKDKFLLQSVIAPSGSTTKDITSEMFNKEAGKVVEECKLRVIYVPANPPSPVPEGSEEGSSPRASFAENGNQGTSLFDAVSRSLEEPKEKSSELLNIYDLGVELVSTLFLTCFVHVTQRVSYHYNFLIKILQEGCRHVADGRLTIKIAELREKHFGNLHLSATVIEVVPMNFEGLIDAEKLVELDRKFWYNVIHD
ncbi:hypothetical protein GIB67_038024 [Kingdonia uniflora]|uniref:MSP domain-containing protein n=1 Tax=Kingdonia uniflora TaxID=39325 RepID=A0A7J7MBZ0_9MAGN|nr:hypothetical protein GIB67_038024 [Kingdonia uniflora]